MLMAEAIKARISAEICMNDLFSKLRLHPLCRK